MGKPTEEEIEAYTRLIPQEIKLSLRDWNAFVEMLENPPEPNENLKKLLSNHSHIE